MQALLYGISIIRGWGCLSLVEGINFVQNFIFYGTERYRNSGGRSLEVVVGLNRAPCRRAPC